MDGGTTTGILGMVAILIGPTSALLAVWLTNRYHRPNWKFQKLYDRQADILIKINNLLYELARLSTDISIKYLHMPEAPIPDSPSKIKRIGDPDDPQANTLDDSQLWDRYDEYQKKINHLSDEYFKKKNRLDAIFQREKAYLPRSLHDIILQMEPKLFNVANVMCKKQEEDRQAKISLWKEADTSLTKIWGEWVKAYREFIGAEELREAKEIIDGE